MSEHSISAGTTTDMDDQNRLARANYLIGELKRTKINQIIILDQLHRESLLELMGYESVYDIAIDVLGTTAASAAQYDRVVNRLSVDPELLAKLLGSVGIEALDYAASDENLQIEGGYVVSNGQQVPIEDYLVEVKAKWKSERQKEIDETKEELKRTQKALKKQEKIKQDLDSTIEHLTAEHQKEIDKLTIAVNQAAREKGLSAEQLAVLTNRKNALDTITESFQKINTEIAVISSVPEEFMSPEVASSLEITLSAMENGIRNTRAKYSAYLYKATLEDGE